MTSPDDSRDEPRKGQPDGQTGPDVPLDEEEAWRTIVANFGERADLSTAEDPPPAQPERTVFDRSYLDSQRPEPARPDAEAVAPGPDSWWEEGHFVPPEPPPVPRATPARRLAWSGLFGAPLLMLLAVIGHWTYPMWFAMLLVGAFVGGFVFLVATMERRGGDGLNGGDGAVV
jgi:hypothetical protein